MGIPVYVSTSDKYMWAMMPFIYLFNTFWSELQPVTIIGYSPPAFDLPPNFTFFSIDSHEYTAEHWTNGILKFLSTTEEEIFCLLLDDYWLTRTVDHVGVASFADYMRIHPDILRFDLTTDRLHARGDARDALELEAWGHYDLIYTPNDTPYQVSLQAALWRKSLFTRVFEADKSPWQAELYSTIPDDMRVVGSRQWPLRYANAVNKGKIQRGEVDKIIEPHREIIKRWIPSSWAAEVPGG